ncbi:MAG TPA: GspE/PulE family protein [Fimbriimonas sp.]
MGDQLVRDTVISSDQLKQAVTRQQLTGEFLGDSLIALGYITPLQIGPYLEELTGFPFFDLGSEKIDPDLAQLIPEHYSRSKLCIPFRETGNKVHVAMADPLDLAVVDELRAMIGKPMIAYLAMESDVSEAIRRTFDARLRAQSVLEEMSDTLPAAGGGIDTIEALVGLAEDAPIVRLVNSILVSAISGGASDVHIEPQENDVRVRVRIDGMLYEQMSIPHAHYAAVISRLKIISSLDIAERRRPQDGRLAVKDDQGRDWDVRLSIMPTVFGEKACMRLLEKKSGQGQSGDVAKLGFYEDQRILFEKFIHRPHGMILVTGPTGSGKSTTLYTALQTINDPALNINTVEDPVEYQLPGINQMQVNPRIGVTFATGLRTLVRQDPDVILVGEIRDAETAEIAVQAALTGHLVLSTLHTNDAPGALVRLQNMGVEPFLIASAVIAVLGQRLLRTACPNCKVTSPLEPEFAEVLGLPRGDGPYFVARGQGCPRCGGRGTKGRTAVYEIMSISDEMRAMVLRAASGNEIMAQAVKEGMRTMRESAIQKMLDHQVPPEEVLRVMATE